MWTTHLNRVSSLRMSGAISLRPLYAFVGCISTTLSLGKDFCKIMTKSIRSATRGDSVDNYRAWGPGGGAKSTRGIKNFNLQRTKVRNGGNIGSNHP